MNNKIDNFFELDLRSVINIVRENIFPVLTSCILFIILSVVYSLSLNDYYKSEALLTLSESNQSQSSGLSANLGTLSSLAGVTLPNSSQKLSEATAILKSRSFIKTLISHDGFLENIMASYAFDISSKEILYDETIYNSDLKKWVREETLTRTKVPSVIEVHDFFHDELFSIIVDQKNNFIILSAEHLSPVFANELLEVIVEDLNIISKEYSVNRSQKIIKNLRNKILQEPLEEVRSSLNNLMEVELKKLVLADIDDNFLLRYLDEPFVPIKKSKPSRSFIVILGGILGLFIGIFYSIYLGLAKKTSL